MNAPTKQDLIASGYKMTANAADAQVSRCADIVLREYLLHVVASQDVSDADANSAIGRAWRVLTFLRFLQDDEFATRTGGENKRYQYGDRIQQAASIKAEAAARLADLYKEHPGGGEVCDVCGIYFKTQLFY